MNPFESVSLNYTGNKLCLPVKMRDESLKICVKGLYSRTITNKEVISGHDFIEVLS
jgi:hypothetical protein